MPLYAIFSNTLGTATARPVVKDFWVDDLPEDTFAARLLDAAGDVPSGHGYVELTPGSYFSDLDGDASTYEYTVNTSATPPVALDPVTVDRYSLEEQQTQVANRRDLLLASGLQLLAGDRVLTDTDLGTVATYLAALRAISDTEASPGSVVFPTLGALANNASANLLTRTYRRGNAVGAVSFSGGIPAGAMFQTETNSNGLLYRTADGFQVCRARLLLTYFSSTRLAATFNFAGAFYNDIAWSIGWSLSTRDNSNAADGLADTDLAKLQLVTGTRSTTSVPVSLIVNGSGLTLSAGDKAWIDISIFGRWQAP
jgi:hypothetical protein